MLRQRTTKSNAKKQSSSPTTQKLSKPVKPHTTRRTITKKKKVVSSQDHPNAPIQPHLFPQLNLANPLSRTLTTSRRNVTTTTSVPTIITPTKLAFTPLAQLAKGFQSFPIASLHTPLSHNHFEPAKKISKRSFTSATKTSGDDSRDQQQNETEKAPIIIGPMSDQDFASNPICVKSTLPFETPPLDKIKLEHFKPAILHGIHQQKLEIKKITENTDEPTFENTIHAYELTGDLYSKARGILGNFSNSDSTDELMELEDELTPVFSNHSDDIHFDPILFKRIDTVFQQLKSTPAKFAHLTEENRRLIEITHRGFVLAGAKLSEAERAQMRELNTKLSSLEQTFSNNIVKILQHDGIVITDVKELDGLSPEQIDEAAAIAKEKKLPEGQYVLNLVNTTRNPLLQSLKNRDVRRQLFELSTRRGLEGKYQQTDLVYDILVTRAKTAKLLGFKNFSEYQLQEEMATPDSAREMLTSTVQSVMKNLDRESKALITRLKKDLGDSEELQPWDWEFFAELVRAQDYDVDPTIISKYFEFENVLTNGVFKTMNLLFGITFNKRTDIPTQHDSVSVYEIIDHDGSTLGLYHADYFKRPAGSPTTKSGGAWMSEWVGQNFDRQQKPVIINNMNIVRAGEGKPTFLTLDEVSTAFHELGHGLHGAFSRAQHTSLAGTNTSTDYVEFPSTLMEDWSIHPQILKNYAKHYETGEEIPQDLLQRVIDASKFNLGFETLEYVSAALIDLDWHSLPLEDLEAYFAKFPTKSEAIDAFEIEGLKKYGAYSALVPPRYRMPFFSHSMTSYSSRYYAYFWSEVLAADGFRYISHLCDTPGPNREIGEKLRQECYSTGNTRDPIVSYESFRGRPATTEAILLRRGLSVIDETKQ